MLSDQCMTMIISVLTGLIPIILCELSGLDLTLTKCDPHTDISYWLEFVLMLYLILKDEFVLERTDPSRIEASKHMIRAETFFEKHKAVPKARYGELA